MKVVLVNPPRTHYDLEELAPPLGLLRLAHVAQELGAVVYIEDYNLLWHGDHLLRERFYETAVARLAGLDGDLYGFTSMAVDSHVALELARLLKRVRPEARIVLGGPHFSSIAEPVKARFPWVDHVICGEGEAGFADLINPGGAGTWVGNPQPSDLPIMENLAAYFHLNPRRMVNLEAGRGCRFKCSFCYSPSHYQAVREFPVQTVIAQLDAMQRHGAAHVWFVHDNFLNDINQAVHLCQAIKELRSGLTWSCYATLPQLTPRVMEAMAEAGCTEVFSGIDAVGTASERAFRKAFFRGTTPLQEKIRTLRALHIQPTLAFLVCPPSHVAGATYQVTVAAAVEAQSSGADILLNPLNLYTGTGASAAFGTSHAGDFLQADLMMDVPDIVINNTAAIEYPEMFPFHSRYVPEQEWHSFLQLSHCVSTLIHTYPRTLSRLLEHSSIDPVAVATRTLERFSGWERLPKQDRRRVEQDVAFFVLKDVVPRSPAAATLDEERPVIK